jgi:hypothetical protein
MDDIFIPGEEGEEDAFFIRPVTEDVDVTNLEFDKTPLKDEPMISPPMPTFGNKVTINFSKFVQLVANHSYIDIVDKNSDEEVIISGNLLTDLANSHDQMKERRMPLMFVAGLVIGIILTYIITRP